MDTCKKGVLIMYTSTTERFMDKNVMPTSMEIDNLLGKEAYQRLSVPYRVGYSLWKSLLYRVHFWVIHVDNPN